MLMFSLLLLTGTHYVHSQLELNLGLSFNKNYVELYKTALSYYKNLDYKNTQLHIEFALADKRYRDYMLVKCQNGCSDQIINAMTIPSILTVELCSKKCMKDKFGQPLKLPNWIIKDFKNYEPYNYLQYAYYKMGDLKSAYESAKLYLKYNGNSEMMANNVKFYGSKMGEDEGIVLHEKDKSVDLFHEGISSYNKLDYNAAAGHFSNSLNLYVRELADCKTLCQTGFDVPEDKIAPNLTDTHNFQEHVVKLYYEVIECRYQCAKDFDKAVNLDEDYLPGLLNYLQFSAFQEKNTILAAQVATAYLKLKPGDKVMTQNLNYFKRAIMKDIPVLSSLDETINELHSDMELLTMIVGNKEMRRRLQAKQKFVLGDVGSASDLSPDASILWTNTYR